MIALLLACTTDPEPVVAPPPPPSPTNLLVVTLDTVRADHLGPYGYHRETTPALDILASQGTVYTSVYAPVATTLPSHLSLLTGAYPLEHGLLSNHGNHRGDDATRYARNAELATFAQAADARGWDTAAFVSAAPLKRHSGLHVGFDHYDQPEKAERSAEETIALAASWLTADREVPSFALVHLFDAHYPYAAPEPYGSRFAGAPGTAELLAERGAVLSFTGTVNSTVDGSILKQEMSTVELVDAYDGELAYLDAQLGSLFRTLSHAGRLEDTVIVVVGDHGEGLGQHGEWMHGNVHQEQLQVPLIVRVPGQEPGRDDRLLSLADVLPVVLPSLGDWSGFLAQVPERAAGVMGQRTGSLRRDLTGGRTYTWFDGRYKLVDNADGQLLFDLEADPLELTPIDDPERTAAMLETLTGERGAMTERLGELVDLSSGDDPLQSGMMRKADKAPLEELRALGYVE